jgi:hypothetical protein
MIMDRHLKFLPHIHPVQANRGTITVETLTAEQAQAERRRLLD